MQSSARISGGIRWVILSGLLLIFIQTTRGLPEYVADYAVWADYVATMEGLGMDRYVEIHQEAYDQQWKGKH